jgi:hypothetical protein
MHKYFLLAFALSLPAFAKVRPTPEMNPATKAEFKALVANCVDAKEIPSEFNKSKVLESVVSNLCNAFRSGTMPSAANMKSYVAATADVSELQLMRAECVMNVVEGKMANAPRSTKGVDMQRVLSELSNVAGEKMGGYDSPCAPKMCNSDIESQKVKAACIQFTDWDSFRRAADTMSGAEYNGENPDPAQEIALRGFKGIAEQAAVNLMMARGHFPLPQMGGSLEGSRAEEEPADNGAKKAD